LKLLSKDTNRRAIKATAVFTAVFEICILQVACHVSYML